MDIKKWLEETADRAPPDPSDGLEIHIPELFQPRNDPSETYEGGQRRKRKRPSSDSSILAPRPALRDETGRTRPGRRKSDQSRATKEDCSASRSSGSSQSARDSPEEAPVKTYEKRPRRKTRPDRYEPKSKKPRKESHAREESQSKRKRRKSHRTGDGRRTTGLVQSFQLKNGPKNNRLTLKSAANTGLFKHGRSSVQVTGRVPDLVFNEMRFLQKPRDEVDQDETLAPQEMKKRDQQRAHQKEISAYFNKQQHPETGIHEKPIEKGQGGEQDQDKPPVVLPDKPFLGFGSKGAQPDSKRAQDRTTSYFTWSESVRNLSPPPDRQKLPKPNHERNEILTQHPREGERNPHRRRGDHHEVVDNAPDYVRDELRGQWMQSRRTRGPELVEVYQPPAPSSHGEKPQRTSPTKTTSQTLPGYRASTVKDKTRPIEETFHSRMTRGSYRTSDILNIRGALSDRALPLPSDRQDVESRAPSDKENLDPRSMHSISELLRQVKSTVAEPAAFLKSGSRHTKVERKRAARPEDFIDVSRIPLAYVSRQASLRSEGNPAAPSNRHESPALWAVDPRNYAEPSSRQAISWAGNYSWIRRVLQAADDIEMGLTSRTGFTAEQENDEMLDDRPDDDTFTRSARGDSAAAPIPPTDVFPTRKGPRPGSGLFGAQVTRLERDETHAQWQADAEAWNATASAHGLSDRRGFDSNLSVARDEGNANSFAGFWKPHKLY